jgi:protein SCO1/2
MSPAGPLLEPATMDAQASREAEDAGATKEAVSAGRPSTARRLVVTLALLIAALAIALVGRTFRPKAPIPIIGHVPALALVDQRGAPFTQASMESHVWIADFIFTHCTQTCPKLTARMKELDAKLPASVRDRVRLFSFSVDPENDTPPVLAAYAVKAHADPARWTFVTGPSEAMQKAIVQGFKMTAERTGAGEQDILHGNWLVVGDGAGNIRGYYSVESDEEVNAVVLDVKRLAAESSR